MGAGWFLLGMMAASSTKERGCPTCGCKNYTPPPPKPPKPVEPEKPLGVVGTLLLLGFVAAAITLAIVFYEPMKPSLTLRSPIQIDSPSWQLPLPTPTGPGER